MPRTRLALGLILLLLAALPQPVCGHAVLLDTTPGDGAVLDATPEAIVLRFNEPVRPILVQLRHADIDAPAEPPLETVGHEVRATLDQPLVDGTWLVSYRVSSADGHPVGGAFTITIGEATTAAPPPAEWAGFWSGADLLARTLWYGLLLLIAGQALFLALIRVPAPLDATIRQTIARLVGVALVLGVVLLGIVGGTLLDASPGSLTSLRLWEVALGSAMARSIALASLCLALLALAARWGLRVVLGGGALVVALSFALSGHAMTAPPRWLTVPAVALHALFAAFWLGSLWPLLRAVRDLDAPAAAAVVSAFSRIAVPFVAALLLLGTALTIVQLESVRDLIATDYGKRLALKVGLVAGLVVLGLVNRLVLTPALAAGREAGARGLARSLRADLALGLGVVILTASLNAVPPPRALAEDADQHAHHQHHHHNHHQEPPAARDYAVHATAGGRHLVLVASPARAGSSRIELHFTDGEGRPLAGEEADLHLGPPGGEDAPLRLSAEAAGPGRFVAEQVPLPLAGVWQIRVDLLIDDFTKPVFRTSMRIEP
jgi:copper transport protein